MLIQLSSLAVKLWQAAEAKGLKYKHVVELLRANVKSESRREGRLLCHDLHKCSTAAADAWSEDRNAGWSGILGIGRVAARMR